jgi:chromosome transmission fidelity protein 1
LLLAVVGAKLSEGLNFSNELARAVMVVGRQQKSTGYMQGKDAASELYTNMCMNAVNQSIGEEVC